MGGPDSPIHPLGKEGDIKGKEEYEKLKTVS